MIKINDKEYNIKDWDSLTIEQAQELTDLELPEKLKKLYTAGNEDKYSELAKEITPQDEIDFGVFSGQVLRIMSDIPDELIDYMQYYDRNDLYEYYCRDKIISLLSDIPDYEPKGMESFNFGGETFFLPKGLKIFDRFLPNHSEKSLTFVEGQVLFKTFMETKDTGNIIMLIAVYCRPKGEEYDEMKTIRRAENFKNLTMDIAWEVFFCIYKLLNISLKTINIYYLKTLKRNYTSAN